MLVPLSTTAFWVQIHDIPAGYMTESLGLQLANFIGTLVEFDASNSASIWRRYMRIRVQVDITIPLKRWKKIRKNDTKSFTVNFKYERLPLFCFICGHLGHSDRFCPFLFENPELETKEKGWGPWLRVTDRRNQSIASNKWLLQPGAATGVRSSDGVPTSPMRSYVSPMQSMGGCGDDGFGGNMGNGGNINSHNFINSGNKTPPTIPPFLMNAELEAINLPEDRKRKKQLTVFSESSSGMVPESNHVQSHTNGQSQDHLLAAPVFQACQDQ